MFLSPNRRGRPAHFRSVINLPVRPASPLSWRLAVFKNMHAVNKAEHAVYEFTN
jgi:hypothetical protein